MNFFDAINTHVTWKVHLQNHLLGIADTALDVHTVGQENLCELGRWLYANLTTWQDQPLYWEVIQVHTAFHRCAGEILHLHDAGKLAEAEHLLHHEYSDLSHQLVHALRELSRIIDSA